MQVCLCDPYFKIQPFVGVDFYWNPATLATVHLGLNVSKTSLQKWSLSVIVMMVLSPFPRMNLPKTCGKLIFVAQLQRSCPDEQKEE